MSTVIPPWFSNALAVAPQEQAIEVDGTRIHFLEWGERTNPGLVLVHGGAAHAHWWSYLAPFFSDKYSVVALDMSGHGDSGWRSEYSRQQWAREVLAVADAADMQRPPMVIGHSLGGMVTIEAAALHGDRIAGAIVIDSPVRRPDPESEEGRGGRAFRSPGVYESLDQALTHFRLVPDQPCDNQFIIDHIARHSLHERESGWTWKFDPAVFRRPMATLHDQLAAVNIRFALLRGDKSIVVPPDTADYMYELLGRSSPVIEIPEAHHHLLLDQPLALVAALRTLLADWHHSLPRGRA
ncbi:MAG: alpha/beta hydrolase [Acidimicrobiia bacterium]|nr:alpha/beta hydrolase [Acidimicrobiia bacterium]NNF63077.1 alpha/beta hydrolase [Acidimicrobiia bacterium]